MKQYQYDISIIIVNYNSSDYLSHCIDSIKRATHNLKVEVVVVDNNSTDGNFNNFTSDFDNITCLALDENLGFGKANNIGVSKSSGKYTLILNPDTVIEENTLDIMFRLMEENSDIGISGCKVLNSDGTFQMACRRGFPGPWVSFTKLFGLQSLFPKTKLFSKYNMTYKSIDETYEVDSIIGAFMFIRTDVWDIVHGFDEDFFMYGEDIDLCYRVKENGQKVFYHHKTSIIHYKGISTKRSSIDELGHFYNAMSIFSKKHFSYSALFMLLLKVGILFRKSLSILKKYRINIFILIFDLTAINSSLLIATKFRFGGMLNFPEYAYPTVFITISLLMIFTMIGVGEYFERSFSVRKSSLALLASFFILSSLTYFFNDFAFSRGVVLMTIGFSIVLSSFIRIVILLYNKIKGREKERLVGILGTNEEAVMLSESFNITSMNRSKFMGFISTRTDDRILIPENRVLGNYKYLKNIIADNYLNDIIITDNRLSSNEMISIIRDNSETKVKFHIASKIDDYIASNIINEIAGTEPGIPKLSINTFKNRTGKRIFDLIISSLFLTIGFPVVYLLSNKSNKLIRKWIEVLKGKLTVVGLYSIPDITLGFKIGIIGLGHISNPKKLTNETLNKLNEFYIVNYSFMFDIEIILKYLIRKKSGK